ncbi:MAG: flagellar motor protein MotB [Alphaproteobacteria bacterium]|nr:flagellar motor protein MotB [Alphaproteobacteria bacterium]
MADDSIVIKKIKKIAGHGHHGGAWKVAYADFVTAMMAFFLLMWLINTTSPEQKRGIADYFAPASVSRSTSGSGGILDGTSFGENGGKSGGAVAVVVKMAPEAQKTKDGEAPPTEAPPSEEIRPSAQEIEEAAQSSAEQREFEQAEMSLRQAMQDMPDLAELSKQILIDITPEGLRLQLVDQEGRPMFAAGSAEPTDRVKRLLVEVAKIVLKLPNRISISGHTDSGQFEGADGYSNWELSADRANATRKLLMASGVPADRIFQVSGKAGSEPLLPEDPYASANRRMTIVLLREAPPLPAGTQP